MIVMKFGGTSVEDEAAIERAAAIVFSRLEEKPVVVVSALAGVTENTACLPGHSNLYCALFFVRN